MAYHVELADPLELFWCSPPYADERDARLVADALDCASMDAGHPERRSEIHVCPGDRCYWCLTHASVACNIRAHGASGEPPHD